MEVIDRDRGTGQPHPQRFAECCGGIDRHYLHGQTPCQRPGEEPVPDALVVPAVHYAQDLAGVQIHDRGHPGFTSCPGLRDRVLKIAYGPEPVLIDAEHPRAERVYVGQPEQGSFI